MTQSTERKRFNAIVETTNGIFKSQILIKRKNGYHVSCTKIIFPNGYIAFIGDGNFYDLGESMEFEDFKGWGVWPYKAE